MLGVGASRFEEGMELTCFFTISNETGIPLVATNDSHYTHKTDNITHDVCLCIQTNNMISDSSRLKFEASSYYLKSFEEMKDLFS